MLGTSTSDRIWEKVQFCGMILLNFSQIFTMERQLRIKKLNIIKKFCPQNSYSFFSYCQHILLKCLYIEDLQYLSLEYLSV